MVCPAGRLDDLDWILVRNPREDATFLTMALIFSCRPAARSPVAILTIAVITVPGAIMLDAGCKEEGEAGETVTAGCIV